MAVPPAVLGAAMLAKHGFPAHADFLQHANRGGVVDVHRRDHAVRAQIEECRVDQSESDLGRQSLAPVLDAQHVSQVDDVALDEGQIAGPDHAPGFYFLDGQLEPGSRPFALRGQQAFEIFGGAVLVAGAEKKVARDARIRRIGGHGAKVGLDEFAQVQAGGADRKNQRTHSTLPGFMMPFGSSARFNSCMTASSTGSARRANSAAFSRPMPCSALMLPPRLSTRSNIACSSAGPRATKLLMSASGFWLTLKCRLPSPAWP